ncbi:MFS transporter [Nonomuraea rubra]|uniref:MFS transporter n=1 Tax=Nonomuraea rubra TaxID=46180 RepID=UPI0033D35648
MSTPCRSRTPAHQQALPPLRARANLIHHRHHRRSVGVGVRHRPARRRRYSARLRADERPARLPRGHSRGRVLADRLPRLSIIVACQLICGIAQLIAAGLILTGSATVWALAGLTMVAGAAGAFFQPAAKGLIVQLVPAGPMLVQANALLQIAFNAVAIIGPGLAGLVIAASSPGVILAWDAASFLVSAAVFATLPLPSATRPGRRWVLADLVEGWEALAGRRWLWALTGLSMLTSACWAAGMSVLGPIYATPLP